MTPIVDVTWLSYATAGIVGYYVLLFFMGQPRGAARPAESYTWPLIVIVIPARNEVEVLARTVETAMGRRYPAAVRILIMDDASTDGTAELADGLARLDERIRVCHRGSTVGGRGKSDVLNHAYGCLRSLVTIGDTWLEGTPADQICLCVLDADGHLSPSALVDGAAFLCDPRVGAVQIGVQIRNARDNLLARLQDMEFVGFSFMVQTARDRLGSVGLGGNGQFTRLEALAALGDQPWRSQALTEDLDLGIRLQLAGWKLRFCSTAWVAQEGLTRPRPLLRQRTRWTQGHYQCWRYVPQLVVARRLRPWQRLDTLAYLLFILLVVLVSLTGVIEVLGIVHAVQPTDEFLGWLGSGFAYRLVILLLSWLPVVLLVVTYQRFALARLALWECPAYCLFFAAYVYLWVLATARAWTRMAMHRGSWTKTPRLALVGPPSGAVRPTGGTGG